MKPNRFASWRLVVTLGVFILVGGVFLIVRKVAHHPEDQKPGKFPEQLVYVRSADDVVDAGALFAPPRAIAKPIAVIWIHGWGANFYTPSYVGIARALANQGYATIIGNTRMHDIGNMEKYSFLEKRVRGGGYWGVTSQDALDIAAWVDFAGRVGFSKVVLVGHSAGWASVGRYQAAAADRRVIGVVFASPGIGPPPKNAPELVAQASELVSAGAGEDLLRLPNRSFPSFISAATYLDMENTPPEYKDFWGIGHTGNPAILRVKCPILAFFGARDDIGGEKELTFLTSTVQRLAA